MTSSSDCIMAIQFASLIITRIIATVRTTTSSCKMKPASSGLVITAMGWQILISRKFKVLTSLQVAVAIWGRSCLGSPDWELWVQQLVLVLEAIMMMIATQMLTQTQTQTPMQMQTLTQMLTPMRMRMPTQMRMLTLMPTLMRMLTLTLTLMRMPMRIQTRQVLRR